MSHRRNWLALAIFGALAACATGQPSAQDRGLLSWQGASGEELIAQLGQPETRTALGNGETMLQYRWTRIEQDRLGRRQVQPDRPLRPGLLEKPPPASRERAGLAGGGWRARV